MPVAELAVPTKIARDGGHRPERRADDGLGDERDHVSRPQARDFRLELGHEPLAVRLVGLAGLLATVGIARCDVRHVHQQRLELLAARDVAAGRKRTERVPVVALQARDHVPPLRLADLDEVLARELQRGFHRLRAAAHEVHARHPGRGMRDQLGGERLHRLVREERGVREREPAGLRRDRRADVGIAMTEAGNSRAAGAVEVAPACRVDEVRAVTRYGDRILVLRKLGLEDIVCDRAAGRVEQGRRCRPQKRRGQPWGGRRSCAPETLAHRPADGRPPGRERFRQPGPHRREQLVVARELVPPLVGANDRDRRELFAEPLESGPLDVLVRGTSPIGFSAPCALPWQRSTIHFSTRMFSPNPGQMNLPLCVGRNQLTRRCAAWETARRSSASGRSSRPCGSRRTESSPSGRAARRRLCPVAAAVVSEPIVAPMIDAVRPS